MKNKNEVKIVYTIYAEAKYIICPSCQYQIKCSYDTVETSCDWCKSKIKISLLDYDIEFIE